MRKKRPDELRLVPGFFQLVWAPIIAAGLVCSALELSVALRIIIILIGGTGWFAFLYLASQLPKTGIVFGKTLYQGKGDEKKLYLTFDDGPHRVYTPKLLDLLARKGAKGTFFLLGKNAEVYPDIVRRIRNEGHTIGSHTVNHKRLAWSSNETIITEIDAGQEVIKEITGEYPQFFRPPFASRDLRVMKAAKNRELTVTMWSIDTYDWSDPGVDAITERVGRLVHPGGILLFHDSSENPEGTDRSQTVESVEKIIDIYKERGYTFPPLKTANIKTKKSNRGEYTWVTQHEKQEHF